MNLPSRFYVFAAAATVFIVASCSNQSAMNESTASVKHITQADFEMEVTRCTNPVVADFYATWCGPCRVLSPMLDRLAGGYADKVKFVKINVDESPGIAQNFQAEELPLVIFFRDGKVADRLTNMPTESDLKARLDAFYAGK